MESTLRNTPRGLRQTGSVRRSHPLVAFNTLGEVVLCKAEGGELRSVLVQPKQLALLSYICCEPCVSGGSRHGRRRGSRASTDEFLRRDVLVALLWPEHDSTHAHGALRQALHSLRQELGTRAIVTRGKTEVAVNRSVVWCDVCAFMDALERDDLEGAVSKYGGAFLHGLHTAEAPEFVRWMETSRDRLARLYAIGIERLADEETQRGDMLAAAERWRRLWEMDPYNSRIVIRAMEALDAAGARCEALRLAERHEELVAQTFGADLEPIVKALAERLRKPTGGTHLAS